jgi:hypothetical protein
VVLVEDAQFPGELGVEKDEVTQEDHKGAQLYSTAQK